MPIEALVSPLPSELTTPPVTKMCFGMSAIPGEWCGESKRILCTIDTIRPRKAEGCHGAFRARPGHRRRQPQGGAHRRRGAAHAVRSVEAAGAAERGTTSFDWINA